MNQQDVIYLLEWALKAEEALPKEIQHPELQQKLQEAIKELNDYWLED